MALRINSNIAAMNALRHLNSDRTTLDQESGTIVLWPPDQ